MSSSPCGFLAALGLLTLAPPSTAAETASAVGREDAWRNLEARDLCVTHGSIEVKPSKKLSISNAEVRAVSRRGIARAAELRFTSLGPSDETALLGSGQLRRQVGLKLRAQDGCNLVYVMWRVEPKNQLVVSVKSNPGMSTHAECGTHGYENIQPSRSVPVPVLRVGEPHRLRAVLAATGDGLEVFVDEMSVWSGALGQRALAFDGPIGVRTDNLRVVTELYQSAEVAGGTAPSMPCLPTKDD